MKTRSASLFSFLALGSFVLASASITAGCSSKSDENVGTTNDALQCAGACVSGDLSGDGLLTPVNRSRGLRSDWAPNAIALPPQYVLGAQRLRPEAHEAFIKMTHDAYVAGVDLYCSSGYRSFQTQCTLFASYADTMGCEGANLESAHAGHSEHQLGTVCDIALGTNNGSFLSAGDAGDVWLRAHAHDYGFANSYPHTDKSQNDGYIHEPWHYRFIGVAAAQELKRRGKIAVPVFIASLSEGERATLEAGGAIAPGGGGGDPVTPPPPPPPPPGGGCGDLTSGGRCVGEVLEWCKNGAPASVDCATTQNGFTMCGRDPNPANGMNCIVPSTPCRGFDDVGTCTGAVLEWCDNGTYKRVDCGAKTDGRNACGADPNPALGMNCIAP